MVKALRRGLGVLVVGMVVAGLLFLGVSYAVSVLDGHVYAAFPFIRCDVVIIFISIDESVRSPITKIFKPCRTCWDVDVDECVIFALPIDTIPLFGSCVNLGKG